MAVLLAFLPGMAAEAAPKNCRSDTDRVAELLCSDAEFRRADRAMSAAYFDLLRSVADREMHDALVFSQRRWLRARKNGVLILTTDADPPAELQRRTHIEVTRAREAQFRRKAGDGRTPAMVAAMLDQRKALSRFPGGPFQGFSTDCGFVSPPYGSGYLCTGTVAVQSGRRVCAHSLEWASGHETDIRIVATADGGRLEEDAVCKDGYDTTHPICPHPDKSWVRPVSHRQLSVQLDEDARSRDRPMGWERPGSYDLDLDRHPLRSLDPEGDDIEGNLGFLRECTSEADYPRRSIRRPIGPGPAALRGRLDP